MRALIIFSIAFLSFSSHTLANCIQGNCKNGKGIYQTSNGDQYIGTFKNTKINGKGRWKSRYGDVYRGSFVDGKMDGAGKLIYSNGEIFIGEFRNGQLEGKGKFTYRNGDTYIGKWVNGLRHGSGTYYYVNGTKEDHIYQKNLLVSGGHKKKKEEDYTASAPNTTFNEAATEETSDYGHITKDCTDMKCHDELGVYHYSDGSRYIGEFQNGTPTGKGRCEYVNGDIYEGGWAIHSPHGEGIMMFSNGKKYAALWEYGIPKEQLLEDIDYTSSIKNTTYTYSEDVDVYALVVGVATYQHLPSLKYTDDDAYQVYAFLKSPEGGAIPNDNIKVLVDDAATRINILNAMDQLFSKADENDVIMLYMSGHGLEGSFVPSDFDGYSNQLAYKDITKILDKSKAKHKLAIADACHSGSIVASRGTDFSPAISSYYNVLENLESGGTALLLSSAANELSLEYSGLRQGVFSHYLMNGLRGMADVDNNKMVTISELYKYIYKNVRRYTENKQSPILTGSYNRDMPVAVIR